MAGLLVAIRPYVLLLPRLCSGRPWSTGIKAAFSAKFGKSLSKLYQRRHDRFYFDDGTVVFLVDNVLFKVHRYFLEHKSEVFQTMFMLRPPEGQEVEGESAGHPIILEDTRAIDFERFLTVFYPRDVRYHDLSTFDEWVSVVEFASKWLFTDIRGLAITRATAVGTLAEQIVMARRYDLPELLREARRSICERPQPLTLEEGRQLGVDEVIILSESRHLKRTTGFGVRKYTPEEVDRLNEAFRALEG
ncbi:uncharacterized protein FIBRA_05071 [Fibroporia radiculosa]|uniref:BTB domain-containing protein n=1 Tax=Fibroporia radiculosa TaxID=599839 RepID=J4IAI2_9APHY|nr:uncharacterized protein FIBRA_05071 [Fibroporia radiculosa]CCM02956.1 predicted protein [Fibroporia radiculosa]